MLENARICDREAIYPGHGVGSDDPCFRVVFDVEWTLETESKWTYVLDLDNLVFTVNGITHFKLDNLPPNLDDYSYSGNGVKIPSEYLSTTVNLWPTPNFNAKECQKRYDSLRPIIIPVIEWGAPTWDELSVSQRFSIEITHHLLHETSGKFTHAYAPSIRSQIGGFCWDMICASVPALPLFQQDDFESLSLSRQTLSLGFDKGLTRKGYYGMRYLTDNLPIGSVDGRGSTEYFWIRGCLVTFCVRLGEPVYLAYEVEQMVQRMRRHGGATQSVGIILSSQQELVAVAIDGPEVRHSPVLDIRATPPGERPGRATDGRLLLTYLLSPPLTVSPLPWRTRPRESTPISSHSITKLPPDVLRIIVHQVDTRTYLSLCGVSRSIHSICVANPRVGHYTVLREITGLETTFVARSPDDYELKTIVLQWKHFRTPYSSYSKWEIREVPSPEAKLATAIARHQTRRWKCRLTYSEGTRKMVQ